MSEQHPTALVVFDREPATPKATGAMLECMTWVVPEPEVVDEPFGGTERATLEGFLDAQRHGFLRRCAGLDGDQLVHRSTPPSDLSLLGLMRHLTDVERHWFRNRFSGADLPLRYSDAFGDLDPDEAQAVYEGLVEEWAECRASTARLALDDVYVHDRFGRMSLRWLYIHLIREYAGHIGQADLIRQRIDGRTFS